MTATGYRVQVPGTIPDITVPPPRTIRGHHASSAAGRHVFVVQRGTYLHRVYDPETCRVLGVLNASDSDALLAWTAIGLDGVRSPVFRESDAALSWLVDDRATKDRPPRVPMRGRVEPGLYRHRKTGVVVQVLRSEGYGLAEARVVWRHPAGSSQKSVRESLFRRRYDPAPPRGTT